jgi:hypothetical protein
MISARKHMRFYALAYRQAIAAQRLTDAFSHLLTACLWRSESRQAECPSPSPLPAYVPASPYGITGQPSVAHAQRPGPTLRDYAPRNRPATQ